MSRRSEAHARFPDWEERLNAISISQAHKWNRDARDMKSVVYEAYVKACNTWRDTGGANFSTYFNKILNNSVLKYLQKYDVPKAPPCDENGEPVMYEGVSIKGEWNPVIQLELKEQMSNLSKDAQSIVDTILTDPEVFLRGKTGRRDLPPTKMRGYLYRWLIEMGWTHPRTQEAFRELKGVFS